MRSVPNAESTADAVADFLSRCTSLQGVTVDHITMTEGPQENIQTYLSVNHTFRGSGATPSERQASMQRQLALLQTTPGFLAPPSWPACSCLTSLLLPGPHPAACSHLRLALQTTCLVTLTAHLLPPAALLVLHSVSALPHLAVSAAHALALPLFASLAASFASLSSLQRLSLARMLPSARDPSTQEHVLAVALLRSWLRLGRLTSLELSECCPDLRWLRRGLRALREIETPTADSMWHGSLATLFTD